MDALLPTGYMPLEMVRMPTPEPGPDDVLARVRACGRLYRREPNLMKAILKP
jgi:hypothetical protein